MNINMDLVPDSYDILVERGCLARAGEYLDLQRRVLVVTDSGVPAEYARILSEQCREATVLTVAEGEGSKSLARLEELLLSMLRHGFSRRDLVVAVGGGVVVDLAGLAAATYMRGIDFYNVPTTLLSQIDSSIGGKTAINLGGVKNIVGAFHQPKRVLIDPALLDTLPRRQISNGLAEAIKVALTSDAVLFDILERGDIRERMDEIIVRALTVKKNVVEQDEREAGLRRVLNFGHTVGHGIESSVGPKTLYHGECVALGMLPMCAAAIRPRVVGVLKRCGLLHTPAYRWEAIAEAILHDKKADGDSVTVTVVDEVGSFSMRTVPCAALLAEARAVLGGLSE